MYDDSGGDPALLDGNINLDGTPKNPGIMPGDIQIMLTNLLIFVGTVILMAYLAYIMHTLFYRKQFSAALYNTFIFFIVIGLLSSSVYYLNT
jgi:hypothetical protein